MKIKLNADSYISIVSLIIGVYWTIKGFILGFWNDVSPGAGFFPVFIGVVLIILSIKLFFESRTTSVESITKNEIKWIILVPLIAIIIVISMKYIGTMISLIVFFMFWFIRIENFSISKSLKITSIAMVVIYLIFRTWLQVPFPKFLGLF